MSNPLTSTDGDVTWHFYVYSAKDEHENPHFSVWFRSDDVEIPVYDYSPDGNEVWYDLDIAYGDGDEQMTDQFRELLGGFFSGYEIEVDQFEELPQHERVFFNRLVTRRDVGGEGLPNPVKTLIRRAMDEYEHDEE